MLTDELDLSEDIRQSLKEQGFVELHPPQAEAIPKALEGRSLVVAVPTASGKSLIGYCAALKKIVEERRRVLYIVPLKALATEKKEDFDRFAHLGFKVGISIGDLDSDDRSLNDSDVIVSTSEKADSLMRHGSRWMESVGLVIADEIHMIHDPGRGPTLEVALTKMRRHNPDLQVIALSATISNASDLAMWLDADLVRSDWRPIELKEGVYQCGEINFSNGCVQEVPQMKEEVLSLVLDIIGSGGQSIVFVNARRSTESLAVKYSRDIAKVGSIPLTEDDLQTLEGDTESTAMGRKLASCVKCGIAFHHAGLAYAQRKFIEDGFRNGRIKCIVATPTLAAGINLPARRVIIRDTTRFEAASGNSPIPVMEIKQMCGRAGRPGYDPYGEAILMARSQEDADHLMQDYIECEPEHIMSKLGNERILKMHILGLIATEEVSSIDDIIDFLRDSFYGSQSSLYGIEGAVENVVEFLAEEGMVEDLDDTIRPLPFGKRVSDLYIEPESAVILKHAMERYTEDSNELLLLHAIASTPDVLGMYPKRKEREELLKLIETFEEEFLVDVPDEADYHFDYFMGDLKTARMMEDWISEKEEDSMVGELGIGPGDIRSRVESMDWLTYAAIEIATIFKPEAVKRLRRLSTRIRYGVKEELVDLVSMKGVGRARARTLFDNGIRDRRDVAEADFYTLAGLPRIGSSLAKSLKMQTDSLKDIPMDDPPKPMQNPPDDDRKGDGAKPSGNRQATLFDF